MESATRANVKIFYKDTQNQLQGPFTERQVQDWYREMWFDSSIPFYFMKGNERPTEHTEFLTLDTLRTLNGIGCPFASIKPVSDLKKRLEDVEKSYTKSMEKLIRQEKDLAVLSKKCDEVKNLKKRLEDVEKSNVKSKEKLIKQEKELTDLSKKCDGVKELEKRVENVKKRLKELSAHPPPTSSSSGAAVAAPLQPVKKTTGPEKKAAAEVKSAQQPKQSDEKIGNAVAAYVLDALAVYASGDYGSWEKARTEIIKSSLNGVKNETKKVCERILVERMKEKNFFCCDLCQEALFNHKQALVHFTGADHIKKETAAVGNSGVAQVRRVLNSFTKLPSELAEQDKKIALQRLNKYGILNPQKADSIRPAGPFAEYLCRTYAPLICTDSVVALDVTGDPCNLILKSSMLTNTQAAVVKAEAAMGRKAFAELHNHLGNAPTHCIYCNCNTGDREGFYAHMISSAHMAVFGKVHYRFDIPTLLVNVHRKELI